MRGAQSAYRLIHLMIISLLLSSAPTSKAFAFTPYRLLVEAIRSPERPASQARDKALNLKLRKAVALASPESTLAVSSYVRGNHAYLVGWVSSDQDREKLEDAAHTVEGLISVAIYLPVKPTGDAAPSRTDELELKAKVVAAIALADRTQRANISVEVLGTHVILVGVVNSASDIQIAGQATRDTSGVSGMTNFLTVPLGRDRKRF